MYTCRDCGSEHNTPRKLLHHVSKEHNLNSKQYYIKFINSRSTCIDCNTNLCYYGLEYGFPQRCKSCKMIHQQANRTKEEKIKSIEQTINTKNKQGNHNGGRPKGSKNSYPYKRTKISVVDPYWLHTNENIKKRKETWSNKSDDDIKQMMEKQVNTAIENGNTGPTGMKTYKGKYKVKNPEKYKGDHNCVIYRSGWERQVCKWCDENSRVTEWSSEEIVVPYYSEVDKKYHRYFVDFFVKFSDGKVIIVEVKPHKQTKAPKTKDRPRSKVLSEAKTFVVNQNKWKAASQYAKDNGWEFQIWTEKELTAMGIMPKSRQPLKKMKPFSRKPTK